MHCKDVSIKKVEVPLNTESIRQSMEKQKAYVRTEYLVLENNGEYAVIRLSKGDEEGLFQTVKDIEVISLPEDTIFIKDHSVDVLNSPAMALLQREHEGKTVVIEGMFSHINFVSGMNTYDLRVIDNIPPSPSKLRVLVDIALSSGYVDVPVVPHYVDVDMAERIEEVHTEGVMFPCRVSGLSAKMPVYFLDEAPKIEHEVTLIGCGLSQRIYHSVYGKDVPFINVCPIDEIPDDNVKTIVKCCKIKEGHLRNGNTVMVPWGATVPEIVGALIDLFNDSE